MTTAINANPTPETWRHVKLVPGAGGCWHVVSYMIGSRFGLLARQAAGLASGEALKTGAKMERFLAGNTHRR